MNIETIKTIQEICTKPPGNRPVSDISFLIDFTKNIKLFKDLSLKQGENAHASCCQYLLYEFIPENEYVFHHGDIGTKFYILALGEVSIEIPQTDSGRLIYTEIMTFTSGSSFGELALESSKVRSASAKCKTPSHLLALLKKDYNRLMQRMVNEKKNEMTNFLQSLPAFSKLNKLVISKLIYNIREISYTKGQIVFKEGEEAKDIYIINEGECKLCKVMDAPHIGNSVKRTLRKQLHTAKRLGRGSMIGEDDVFNKQPRTYCCITASNHLTLYAIPAIDFFTRITAEQPLRYLKKTSKEKKKFLSGWTDFRNSLDSIFVKTEIKVHKPKPRSSNVTNLQKLHMAVSERKLLMSRNQSVVNIERGLESRRNESIGYRKHLVLGNSVKEINFISQQCSPLPGTAINGIRMKNYKTKTLFF